MYFNLFSFRCASANILEKILVSEKNKFREEIAHENQKEVQEQFPIETEFQWALRVRNFKKLDQLLDEDSSQSITSSAGNNALALACGRGDIVMIEWFLKHLETTDLDIYEELAQYSLKEYSKGEINQRETYVPGLSILHNASKDGFVKLFKFLVSNLLEGKIDINAVDEDGKTIFQLAFENKHDEIVDFLLEQSETRSINLNGTSVLHEACFNCDTKKVKFLCNTKEGNINLNLLDKYEIMKLACLKGHEIVVEKLLQEEESIDLNRKDSSGRTCFHHACEGNQPKVEKFNPKDY